MRTLFFLVTILFTLSASAQRTTSSAPVFDKAYYLKKSRQQKTMGTVTLTTGIITAAVGGYIWFLSPIAGLSESGDVEGAERLGKGMVVAGGSLIGISIPLYIAANKNKEKAKLYTGTNSFYVPTKGYTNQFTVGISVPLR